MKNEEPFRQLCRRLLEIANLDEGRRDLGGMLSRAATLAREFLDVDLAYAALDLADERIVSIMERGAQSPRSEAWKGPGALGQRVLSSGETTAWYGAEQGGASAKDFIGIAGTGAWIGAAIELPDRPSGLLVATREESSPFDDEEREVLACIAKHLSNSVGILRALREAESLAVTDDLTRVYNYRFLKTALRREVERSARYGQSFSILMLDVDHLKRYNEENGHLKGSRLLRDLAEILTASSRAIDLVAKYGGDEFLLILPQTRSDGAVVMGNRIRQAVEDSLFSGCRPGDITVSIGVASFPDHGATMEALIAAADEALFGAKKAGRNTVVAADRPGNPSRIPELA